MSLELSLYQLESQLSELIEMREQAVADRKTAVGAEPAEKTREIEAIDNAIREYITAEIRKVDGIRAFWRHCELMAQAAKEEADVQAVRSKAWRNRLDRLKDTVKLVMETIPFPEGKPKKLEGRTGALYLKANGGKQAVEIHDESLVPDELCMVTATMPGDFWESVVDAFAAKNECYDLEEKHSPCRVTRVPSLSLIAERLAQKCTRCAGNGDLIIQGIVCDECGGSGRQSVPGARFAERGNHVEVK